MVSLTGPVGAPGPAKITDSAVVRLLLKQIVVQLPWPVAVREAVHIGHGRVGLDRAPFCLATGIVERGCAGLRHRHQVAVRSDGIVDHPESDRQRPVGIRAAGRLPRSCGHEQIGAPQWHHHSARAATPLQVYPV